MPRAGTGAHRFPFGNDRASEGEPVGSGYVCGMRTPIGLGPPVVLGRALASAGLGGIAAGFRATARLRAARAFHPAGEVVGGVLIREGLQPPIGVAWLDGSGRQEVLVRLSRGIGLPRPCPDVLGLAIRVPGPDGPHDLLLSTGGRSVPARHLPIPRRTDRSGYTSIASFRTVAGPVMVGAFPDTTGFTLQAARPLGRWHRFARLELDAGPANDRRIAFDPVRYPIAGLRMPPGLAMLRAAAYAGSRRGRAAALTSRGA